MQFSELQKPHDLDLNIGSGHTAYRRASVIVYKPNFIEIGKKLFVDERTVPTY